MNSILSSAAAVLSGVCVLASSARGFQDPARVINDRVRVEWLDDESCWYRHEQRGGGARYIKMDLKSGERTPLFDEARLAAALAERIGGEVRAGALPIEALTLKGGTMVMLLAGRAEIVACDLESYALSAASAEDLGELRLPLGTRPLRSRNGGGSTGLLAVNATGGPVSMIWVDASGSERRYAALEPGGRHRQHTYAGHAWRFEDAEGKSLGSARARRDPSVVVIDGKPGAGARGEADEDDDGERGRPGARREGAASPDGSSRVEFDGANVVLRATSGGATRSLTTDGTAESAYAGPVYWSPDGAKFVVFRATPAQERKVFYVESSPRDQVQPRLKSYEYLKPGDRIAQRWPRLFDGASGEQVPVSDELFANPWSMDGVRWEDDSSRFTFVYNQRGHQAVRVISVDAASGEARAVIDESSPTFIDYSQKFFRHDVAGTGEIIWASERDGWNHLYLFDGRTGALKNRVTSGEWVVRGVDRVDEGAREVWFRACGIVPGQDPYHVHHARVNFDGSGLTVLTPGDGTHSVTPSPDGRYLVDRYSRVDLPPVTEIRRAGDGSLVGELCRAEVVGEGGPPMPTRFVAKGRDGETDIYGMILWPRGFDAGAKYPVIESIYAGPHGAHVPKAFQERHGPQGLADRGFIVVMIDGMGTNWRSKAFHDVCWKNLADAGFADRVAWIRAAAAEFPAMDLENGGRGVGIYGGSAGGQNAVRALIDHHDFYKVAVADCGCHDNRMDKIWWNEAWMGWPVGPEYAASSNVEHAARLEGRLLLIVGEMDENVDPASTMQLVGALVRADKDFDMLVIPGAGHGAAETPYGSRRRLEYFVEHLGRR